METLAGELIMLVEKVENGYIVTVNDRKTIATAEHVAHLIMKFMKDVAEYIEQDIREKISGEPDSDSEHP